MHLQEAVDERYEKVHHALAEERIHRVLTEKARERGFQHPEDAADLLKSALTLDDNLDTVYTDSGEKVSVDDAIDKLAKSKPHWVSVETEGGYRLYKTCSLITATGRARNRCSDDPSFGIRLSIWPTRQIFWRRQETTKMSRLSLRSS